MFADVTLLLLDWLRAETGREWHSKVPDDRPARFGQARRAPGGRAIVPVRETVNIALTCWAETEPEAMADLADARTAIWALRGNDQLGVTVYDVADVTGAAQSTDPETGTPQAVAVTALTVRADPIVPYAPDQIGS